MFNVKFNPSQLEASIENIAMTASSNASTVMRKAVIKIRDLARDFAPYKSGTLEESIQYGTIKKNRRNVYVVYVDLDALAPSGKEVGEYAYIMEEQLHPFGRQRGDRRFNLGKGSIAKAAGGKVVGGRFLSRAVKQGTADLVKRVEASVVRTLSGKRVIGVDFVRDTGGEE
jgi:hypothetical protein